MTSCAFATLAGLPSTGSFAAVHPSSTSSNLTRYLPYKRSRRVSGIQMQLPPSSHPEPPLTDSEKGPKDYKWNDDFPGTLKPGSVDDNFPLEKVLESDVYERMQYQEIDMDHRIKHIFEPDEDFLQWLAEQGRLLPRDITEDELDNEAEKQISGITEEDLDFADDDDKMIAYYSKQGEGSATGASSDFGGFAESSTDASGPGF